MSQPTLFELPEPVLSIEGKPLGPVDQRSYQRRLTAWQRLQFANGRHPATGLSLRIGLADKCGTCKHCVRTSNGNKEWFKCNLVPMTASVKTDIRLKWPACVKWERQD